MQTFSGNKRNIFAILFLVLFVLGNSLLPGWMTYASEAATTYQNADTKYQAICKDDADLLSAAEEKSMLEAMQPITQYGNVAFVSTNHASAGTSAYAQSEYSQLFGTSAATMFVIDMDNRQIYIYSGQEMYKELTKSYANTITDNVYKYASSGDYYTCASEAFAQMYAVIDGQRIAKPMKNISNVMLAIALAILINYFVVRFVSDARKPKENALFDAMKVTQSIKNFDADLRYTDKKYCPQSSSSSSGGGFSGGGGGGGFSGGGGGHSF
ncbi:MAG: TPM domain-containing protein [Eubacteriales bacterium]|nr:TPM domain-containing protein [Eubacteriales bacterium]